MKGASLTGQVVGCPRGEGRGEQGGRRGEEPGAWAQLRRPEHESRPSALCERGNDRRKA